MQYLLCVCVRPQYQTHINSQYPNQGGTDQFTDSQGLVDSWPVEVELWYVPAPGQVRMANVWMLETMSLACQNWE